MKQTAVEWLVDKLSYTTSDGIIISHHNFINKLVEQAKEMEKEQIIKAASNNSAKEAYRAGQDSMYCGCYEIDGCTNYEEWIYKKQTYESNT
jgi:ATPase subunit of ABC transporter with duplicated ATPase domains